MHRITRSLASLTLVCSLSAGTLVAVGAGTAGASNAPAGHHLEGDAGSRKNKDGRDIPKVCDESLNRLNFLVARMSNLNDVANTMQSWLQSGDMSVDDYDEHYGSVNEAAHQAQRDFKVTMWIYIDNGCVKALGPVPILPGWTDMENAAETLAG